MQVLGQIRFDVVIFKLRQLRFLVQDLQVQVNETLVDLLDGTGAILTIFRRRVDKHVVSPNQILARLPKVVVLRNLSQEKEDREAATELELLGPDTCRPIVPLIDVIATSVNAEYVMRGLLQQRICHLCRRSFEHIWLTAINRGKRRISVPKEVRVRVVSELLRGPECRWTVPEGRQI